MEAELRQLEILVHLAKKWNLGLSQLLGWQQARELSEKEIELQEQGLKLCHLRHRFGSLQVVAWPMPQRPLVSSGVQPGLRL